MQGEAQSKTHLLRYFQRVQAPRMMRAQHSQHNLYDIMHSIQRNGEKLVYLVLEDGPDGFSFA
jgi:hypothetical protein